MATPTTIARREPNGALAYPGPIESYKPLSQYAYGRDDAPARIDPLAILSAGTRGPAQGDRPGNPQRSTDGTIYVHPDDADVPALRAALAARGNKGLTVTFPSDDPREFISEFFARYSATRLEAFGDEHSVTTIRVEDGKPVRTVYDAGTHAEKYRQVIATCKPYRRIFFYLMVWGADGRPLIDMSDGLGRPYAIRTTSSHSTRNLLSAIAWVARVTGGRIAGIPFDLQIDPKREVIGPDGTKRRIPVFTFAAKAPQGIRLTVDVWQQLASAGLEQAQGLMLPAAGETTWEDAEAEGDLPTEDAPSPEELRFLERGGTCDARFYEAAWFARVKGTSLDGDGPRSAFLREYTRGATDSLADFLARATEEDAAALIAATGARVGREASAGLANRYAEIFGAEDEDTAPVRRVAATEAIEGTAVEVAGPIGEDGAAGPHGATPTRQDAPEPAAPAPAVPAPAQTTRAQALKRWRNLLEEASSLNIAPREDPVRSTTTIGEIERLCEDLGARIRDALAVDEPASEDPDGAF